MGSPCNNPELDLDQLLEEFHRIGYHKVELFTSWAKSAVDILQGPSIYLKKSKETNMSFGSLHLPNITDDLDHSLEQAVDATEFAHMLGIPVVLFKASTIELYIQAAKPYLEAIEHLNVIPVVQNHSGTALATVEDYTHVIRGINDDRMHTLLEVGHFHSVGVSWKEGYELLGESIALIHIKDQIGAQSVPFGTGEIDLSGLIHHMDQVGYQGDYVLEMEVMDTENSLRYQYEAIAYLNQLGLE